jgi:acetyl-CoA carboxylase biotin carboxyl carrier protein
VSLSAADVAEIMRLVEQSTFDELTLEIDGTKLTLRRGEAVNRRAAQSSEAGQAAAGPAGAGSNEVAASSAALASASQGKSANAAATRGDAGRGSESVRPAPSSDANVQDVQSPLLGTFYRSPKPGAAPFVDVGSVVDENTTVAIIEVMKLMNTVRAGVRGTVTEVLASDGALVEFEQPLLRVRKAG